MRESRTYGSVRGGYRKVSVYSIDEETSREERKMRVCVMTLGSRGDV